MPGYEITYHGEGFEVKITAETSLKLAVVRGAVSKGLAGFKINGAEFSQSEKLYGRNSQSEFFRISDRERTVSLRKLCENSAISGGEKNGES